MRRNGFGWWKLAKQVLFGRAAPSSTTSTLSTSSFTGASGTWTFTARDSAGNTLSGVPVVFSVDAEALVSASLSQVTAAPGTITNDGADSSIITLELLDTDGDAVVGVPFGSTVLAATGTGNTVTQPTGATNVDGINAGSLVSTVAATKVASYAAMGLTITDTANVVVETGAAAVLYTEDWNYASTALMKAAAANIYIENEGGGAYSGVGEGAIDLNIGGGSGGENFVRNTFPDVSTWTSDIVVVNGAADRTDNYTIRQQKNFPAGLHTIAGGGFEMFMRFRFSANWVTTCPWASGVEDHKTLLLYPYPASGGARWSIKIGSVVEQIVRFGDPVTGDQNPNVKNYLTDAEVWGSTYWDNTWHEMLIRVTGLGTSSGQSDFLLDGVLCHRNTGRNYTSFTGLDYYNPGANRNYGQDASMTFDTGLITVSEYP